MNERKKGSKRVAKDLFLDSRPECDDSQGFALHSALKSTVARRTWRRDLWKFLMLLWNTDMAWCGGSANQEILRRCSSSLRSSFRSIRSTIVEYELFLILFLFREGPLIFLSFWGEFCVELTYLRLRGLWNGRLVVVLWRSMCCKRWAQCKLRGSNWF